MKSILFLVPYPLGEAPSQRFRFEQYFGMLKEAGLHYEVQSFFSQKGWQQLYEPGKPVQKFWQVIIGFARRKKILFSLKSYDLIFIHREAAPIGPPVFEWIISKIFKKRIIYDFDDAIWLNDPTEIGTLRSKLKWKSKIASICKWSHKISAGNQSLADYALRFNKNVSINPTTIDTENHHNPVLHQKAMTNIPVIGWTGTHSTMLYLNMILPVLQELEKRYAFKFLLISNKKPHFELMSLDYRPWNKASEIQDLMGIDIGIMPLTEDQWSQGKCGFKALQYMALEIPAVISPVGVNTAIVEHGVHGYICETLADWKNYLTALLEDEIKRREIGKAARNKVVESYSVSSNSETFLSLFDLE